MKKWNRLLRVVGIILLVNYSAFAKKAHPEAHYAPTWIKNWIDPIAWNGIKSSSTSAAKRGGLHHSMVGTLKPNRNNRDRLGSSLVQVKSFADNAVSATPSGTIVRTRPLLLRSASLLRRGKLLKTTH